MVSDRHVLLLLLVMRWTLSADWHRWGWYRHSTHDLELIHDLRQLLRRYILSIYDISNLTEDSQLRMSGRVVGHFASLGLERGIE